MAPTRKNSARVASAGPSSAAGPSNAQSGEKTSPKPSGKTHKRSRNGCFTCRLRRKKCDERHPACEACTNLSLRCEFRRPIWWGSPDQRQLQKDRIKNKIKRTKSIERSNGKGQASMRVQESDDESDEEFTDFNRDFSRPVAETWDATTFGPHFSQPGYVPITYGNYTPYEVDVRTERQTFVNDVPLRTDSSTSTFSAMGPPQLQATLPSFPQEEFLQEGCFNAPEYYGQVEPYVDQSIGHSSHVNANIPVDDYDRPLLDHFVNNVLALVFPILEVHQKDSTHAQDVLRSLETNKSYFHCCLSVSAIHLKATNGISGEQIDHDIMRHRYQAISELCQALDKDEGHDQVLDATLAMIFFHCSVGSPDEHLPDIAWSEHFQAVSNLVTKLDLTNTLVSCGSYVAPPFSMGLTTWIDILGATMLGKSPQFAHSYRAKHLSGTPSGLKELMGCDDRIMYLISEIACLESLKKEKRIDEITLCSHISTMGQQLDHTEPADPTLESPYMPNGAIRPDVLTKNITAIFRLAARLHLCSMIPGSNRDSANVMALVDAVVDALAYIPAGPYGFDRSIVWPLLITGAYSTPTSAFRNVLGDRMFALGDLADLGSFGRMYQLLFEYWRLTDDPADMVGKSLQDMPIYHTSLESPTGVREIKRQQVHWRDVMERNAWKYLLI